MIAASRLRSLVAVTVVCLTVGVAAAQPKMTVVDKGTKKSDGGGSVSYTVTIGDVVPPGMYLAFESATFGEVTIGVSTSIQYYYAGIANGSVHVWRIVRDLKERGFVETERLPIVLPLAADGTTILFVRPLVATPFSLRLKTNPDHSVLVSRVKP